VRELTIQSDAYKLLAACFYEPDKQLFLKENVCLNLASILKEIAPEAEPAALKMQKAISEINDEELLIDYARLFVGPFELLAPPYGSVYLEKKGQVMGDSTITVLKKYQEVGLVVDIKEPPDHIAFELEFFHYLLTIEAEAYVKGDQEKQHNLVTIKKEFLDNLLAPWVPLFCERIKSGATTSFYKSLADCLQKTVENFVVDPQYSTVRPPTEREDDACRTSA
jgi:TorA maturation chaperone TorD